jgi:hypothetical protein
MVARVREGCMTQMLVVPTLYARILEYVAANRIDLSGHRQTYASRRCRWIPISKRGSRRREFAKCPLRLARTARSDAQSGWGVDVRPEYLPLAGPSSNFPVMNWSESSSVLMS